MVGGGSFIYGLGELFLKVLVQNRFIWLAVIAKETWKQSAPSFMMGFVLK
jgi:hypothetical protein